MSAPPTAKWIDGLHADIPAVVAARRVLKRRLRTVLAWAELAAERSAEDIEFVHQLRVATRRADAALELFKRFVPEREHRRLRLALRGLRRAAAAARRDDVHCQMLAARAARAGQEASPLFERLSAALQRSRQHAQADLLKTASDDGRERLRRARRRALRAALRSALKSAGEHHGNGGATYMLGEVAAERLPDLLEACAAFDAEALESVETLHELRLAGKSLRYAVELLVSCYPAKLRDDLYPRIELMQERLGEINDLQELGSRLDSLAFADAGPQAEVDETARCEADGSHAAALSAELEREWKQAQRKFIDWWQSPAARGLLDELRELFSSKPHSDGSNGHPARPHRPQPDFFENGEAPTPFPHRRVAAIDVGTNSIRLVIAETDPLSRFRVIEDIRESTRLGGGMYHTGRLSEQAMAASLAALRRFREVADQHHVERLRAVGTSALREASNADEFAELARTQSGVAIDVIDAEEEARLAFASVASAFNLEDRAVATVDLGGGSTEVVASSGSLIDRIFKLPLGAVRLTDMFGIPEKPGEYRFGDMRRAIDKIIAAQIGELPYPLQMIIGTGGTFTTLARIAIRRGQAGNDGRFPFAVRGFELSDGEVSALLDWLRRMPLEQRRRVPGMSERRAEIIVAGLTIVERLMEHLAVERLRIHDGGIRDGLLLQMIDELGLGAGRAPHAAQAMLASVRGQAERWHYERAHSEHVAHLALRIFDQLAAQSPEACATWARREARDLLAAAALLHDVGTLVSYPRHHRHSYDMILHAQLPLLARREKEIVANIARYHRRGGPRRRHEGFARLSDEDQRLVAHLTGILRIADGLDRLHLQNVRDVLVCADEGRVRFEVVASGAVSATLRAGRRKADVFRSAFHAEIELEAANEKTAAQHAIESTDNGVDFAALPVVVRGESQPRFN